MLARASKTGNSASTSSSSKLSRVGRGVAGKKGGLKAHSYHRPAPEMNGPCIPPENIGYFGIISAFSGIVILAMGKRVARMIRVTPGRNAALLHSYQPAALAGGKHRTQFSIGYAATFILAMNCSAASLRWPHPQRAPTLPLLAMAAARAAR